MDYEILQYMLYLLCGCQMAEIFLIKHATSKQKTVICSCG